MSDRLHIQQLTPNCGTEISGVRVSDFTEAEITTLVTEVANHCVVILPQQFVTAKEQMAFANRLGEVKVYEGANKVDGAPGVMEMQSIFLNDNPTQRTDVWHTDGGWLASPPSFTILGCEQPAPLGGDTMWSNQYLAYDTLSDRMKTLITGLQTACAAAWAPGDEVLHPVVRVHPVTGRKSLYINGDVVCLRLEGIEEDISRPLKDFLYRHSQRPEYIYRHRWSKGDLALWDNRCAMHYAVRDYDPTATRTMHRTLVAGEAPIAGN